MSLKKNVIGERYCNRSLPFDAFLEKGGESMINEFIRNGEFPDSYPRG